MGSNGMVEAFLGGGSQEGPWQSAPGRCAVIWLDIFSHGVRMGQTRRWWGQGQSVPGFEGVEGQLLAVTITIFPGEGMPLEKNLNFNSEIAVAMT